MFVQIIEGRALDTAALKRQLDRWLEELAPGASGWLGTTGGVTSDGRFIAAVRFESAEAAERNAARPEQDAWWRETAELFDGEAAFDESADVTLFDDGGDDSAGFVQFMRARVRDRSRMESLDDDMSADMAEHRPDLLGGYAVWVRGDEVVAVNYFTSEAEARAGESTPLPEQAQEAFRAWQSLMEDVSWYDLTDPWMATA